MDKNTIPSLPLEILTGVFGFSFGCFCPIKEKKFKTFNPIRPFRNQLDQAYTALFNSTHYL